MNTTHTTTTPANGKYPATLAESLAMFQASPPKIGKGNTADVKNEKGVRLYSYTYADLADVNEEVLPRLGAVGLAFTSRPTMLDGQFVLAYSLVHVSGEREDGVYPLPSANGKPQAVGGAITYARRYCLCAVTGIAAAGDDDDAGAAQAEHRQSAGDVFENAAPARPASQGPREQVTQPRRSERMAAVPENDPWYTPEPAAETRPQVTRPEAAETDPAWLDLIGKDIDQIKSKADGSRVWARIVAAFNDHTCTPADRKALEGMVGAKVSAVLTQAEATTNGAAA